MKVRRSLASALCVAALFDTRAVAADPPAAPPLTYVPLSRVTIDDPFWSPKLDVWRTVTVNDCFDKFEKDGALTNFDHIARGEMTAKHGGPQWYDGLVYKMIRGAADLLAQKPDPKLKARIDGYVDRIAAAAAKDPDGYVNTYTQLREPNHRWGQNGGNDREQHDLYNLGCLVEAGVHYYRATGETKLLAVAVRAANLMSKVMGPPPKQNIIPGHAMSEESFVRLYELFKEQPGLKEKLDGVPVNADDYLALARFWIDARGHHEGRRNLGDYDQDHIPVLQQKTIEGHAVRATLLFTGVTAYATAANQPEYLNTAETVWENMVHRRLYLTGGVGAIATDEKFGGDYVLPNTGYLETCAAVANGFFNENLFAATGDSAPVDELERSLYNGALAGVSLKGDSYFYENPLEAGTNRERWAWHACPCCPPMFLKMMGALPGYIYATRPDAAYVNLFISSRGTMEVGGTHVALAQTTKYPWNGDVQLKVEPERPATFDLRVRVPAWCRGGATNGGLYSLAAGGADAFRVTVNGRPVEALPIDKGYAAVRREWRPGDVVEVRMAMPVQRVRANERVEADHGRVALTRGPIVYCFESIDNGKRLHSAFLPPDAPITTEPAPTLLGGMIVLRAPGRRLPVGRGEAEDVALTAIPYYANANRGPAEMMVWLPEDASRAVRPTITSLATPSASHCFASDTVAAMNDERAGVPKNSSDEARRRFTWWDHVGTKEWAQYDFDQPRKVNQVDVYWWDDARKGRDCAAPANWRLLYKNSDGAWEPVHANDAFGTKLDVFNTVTFEPVETTALRIEAQLKPKLSAGILLWRVADGGESK